MNFFVTLFVFVCAVCAYAVPPEVFGFEADVVMETTQAPFPVNSHAYWDIIQQKYRIDSEIYGMKMIEIDDYNSSIRYKLMPDPFGGQEQCMRCYLDEDMQPMAVPPVAVPDGTDIVNGEVCDIWRMKVPPYADWTFCTQQHEPYAVVRTIMTTTDPFGQVNTVTATFSNILVYHPPEGVFRTNSSVCEPPKCKAPVDVVLLVDASGSISSSNFALMKKFASMMASNMTISASDANFGLVQFSSSAKVEFNLLSDEQAVVNSISSMYQRSGSTNMDAGLDASFGVFKASSRNVNKVLIMFTDGYPDGGNNPVAHAQPLKDYGVEIYTVGVGSGVNPKILKDIATEDKNPLQPHYMQASSFTQLLDMLNNVVSAACKGDEACSGQN